MCARCISECTIPWLPCYAQCHFRTKWHLTSHWSLKSDVISWYWLYKFKSFKNTKHLSVVILSHIFQQSLSSRVVPRDCKVDKVIPMPKKCPSSYPSNYRPISLTWVCSKIMEHIIYTQTVKFLICVNVFHPSKHGFQKGLSCNTQLAAFINDINWSINHNIPVDALFLDFEKAFDKLPHKRLL